MSRFLVRAKACHEKGLFGRSGRLAYPSQKNTLLNVLRVQSRGDFSAQYNLFIPAYLEISGGPGDWLIPSKKMSSGRTAMYSPEGIFPLGITHPFRPATKLNKKVFCPERTVCVQSRKVKVFFTPEQPLHPDPVFAGGWWKVNSCMLARRKACKTFPVLERKGDHPTPVGWWKVESTMLEQRKVNKYDKKSFYKNFPHPPSNRLPVFLAIRSIHLQVREVNLPAYYLLPVFYAQGKHANVLSSSSLMSVSLPVGNPSPISKLNFRIFPPAASFFKNWLKKWKTM